VLVAKPTAHLGKGTAVFQEQNESTEISSQYDFVYISKGSLERIYAEDFVIIGESFYWLRSGAWCKNGKYYLDHRNSGEEGGQWYRYGDQGEDCEIDEDAMQAARGLYQMVVYMRG